MTVAKVPFLSEEKKLNPPFPPVSPPCRADHMPRVLMQRAAGDPSEAHSQQPPELRYDVSSPELMCSNTAERAHGTEYSAWYADRRSQGFSDSQSMEDRTRGCSMTGVHGTSQTACILHVSPAGLRAVPSLVQTVGLRSHLPSVVLDLWPLASSPGA